MDWLFVTKVALPTALALFIVYDVLAFLFGGVRATISRVVLAWSRRWPILPLLVGVVLGHLFWPQPIPPDPVPASDYTSCSR